MVGGQPLYKAKATARGAILAELAELPLHIWHHRKQAEDGPAESLPCLGVPYAFVVYYLGPQSRSSTEGGRQQQGPGPGSIASVHVHGLACIAMLPSEFRSIRLVRVSESMNQGLHGRMMFSLCIMLVIIYSLRFKMQIVLKNLDA
jgi:hypothetical protein